MGFIVLWIACAVIGGFIGGNRGRGGTGFILGLLFGPVGCFMILAMSGDRVNCPHCESKISPKATSCPKCTKDLIELDTNFSKENKNNQTESSYLKKLDNDLANLKISMTTYDLLKKKYLTHQRSRDYFSCLDRDGSSLLPSELKGRCGHSYRTCVSS